MKSKLKLYLAVMLSVCMAFNGIGFVTNSTTAAALENVNNGKTIFATSNANTPIEGFLYVGNGFNAINCCNNSLSNGNNFLGKTATTAESAVYVDLGGDYDISSALVYQGSTNANFYDSYCTNYSIYYSTEKISASNQDITWNLAGTCTNGTIYSNGTRINNAENKSTTGDAIAFEQTYVARSVKIVFDKESCMGTGTASGTGTTGTVSILSFQVLGKEHVDETTTEEPVTENVTTGSSEGTLYGSADTRVTASAGYASSNLRNGSTTPLKVGYLTDGNTTGTYYIIANTTGGDTNPWFAVDLGSEKDINKVKIMPGAEAGIYPNANPISYEIHVASEKTAISNADGINSLTWKTVATVTDGRLSEKSVTFPRQNARYVRISVNSYATYCSLYEMSVFETDDTKLYEETTSSSEDTMNVLFVGNSMTYYNKLSNVVEGLANQYGCNISSTAVTQGGTNLIFHSTNANTINTIKAGGYDVVILQDIVGSFNADNLIKGATSLTQTIEQYNPGAKVMFYMSWPVKSSLTGASTLEPYFLDSHITAARELGVTLAPAGEAWYDLYKNFGYDWYCADGKHPRSMGTFVSACTILYSMFPELNQITFTDKDQTFVDNLINSNIDYSGDPQIIHSLQELNDISDRGYYYAHAVAPAVSDQSGNTKYYSVADEYPGATTGTIVDKSIFTSESNIAIGCDTAASTEALKASNATDGNTGSRWESTHGLDDQWLYVDLGTVKNIDKVGFIWEGAYASIYNIQVSDDTENWTTVTTVKASTNSTVQIDLPEGTRGRYVKMFGISRATGYGLSFYEMGVWEDTTVTVPKYTVKIDGSNHAADVEEGTKITMPTTAKYGYYADIDGKHVMLEPGEEYKVTSNAEFTSVNVMTVTVNSGAGIRTEEPAGLRFQTTISTDNTLALNQAAGVIEQGTLITTKDIFENNKSVLTLDSEYSKLTIPNSGWYHNTVGLYCGAVVNIAEANYKRDFVARAYVKIKYTNGNEEEVYSNMSDERSVTYVAKMIIQDDYKGLTESQKTIIDKFAN